MLGELVKMKSKNLEPKDCWNCGNEKCVYIFSYCVCCGMKTKETITKEEQQRLINGDE